MNTEQIKRQLADRVRLHIREIMEALDYTQEATAEELGISPTRVSSILNKDAKHVSIEALMGILEKLGLKFEVKINECS